MYVNRSAIALWFWLVLFSSAFAMTVRYDVKIQNHLSRYRNDMAHRIKTAALLTLFFVTDADAHGGSSADAVILFAYVAAFAFWIFIGIGAIWIIWSLFVRLVKSEIKFKEERKKASLSSSHQESRFVAAFESSTPESVSYHKAIVERREEGLVLSVYEGTSYDELSRTQTFTAQNWDELSSYLLEKTNFRKGDFHAES